MGDSTNIDLSNNKDNSENKMTDRGDVKCLDQINFSTAPSSGENQNCNSKQSAKDLDGEQYERKKKTRRGKPKRKNPYNKEPSANRVKYQKRRSANCSRFRNRQPPVAPNNTNQFLMNDHTDLQELDERLQATANKTIEAQTSSNSGLPPRPPRARDSSFTSADSEEDFFYSSPEDEEEFLTKEFSNAYQDLHVETLTTMSKEELIQQFIQLEEKVDLLTQKINAKNKTEAKPSEKNEKQFNKEKTDNDYENEIARLTLLNEQLKLENERLRRGVSTSASSMDSESDSSSSSQSNSSSKQSESDKDTGDDEVMNAEEATVTVNGITSSQEIHTGNLDGEDMT